MKKLWTGLAVGLVVLIVLTKLTQVWLEHNIDSLINSNPERAYNIEYEAMDLHTFFDGVTLDKISIKPLSMDNGTMIKGSVNYATIKGILWLDLILNNRLSIDEIAYETPTFEITVSEDTTRKTSGKGMQDLFGDLLSGVQLNRFRIDNGSVLILDSTTGSTLGQIRNMNIKADGLQTDVVQLNHLIPFELKSLDTQIDTAFFQINDYTNVAVGEFHYDTKQGELLLRNVSMTFTEDWKKVSKKVGKQVDLITFDLAQLVINGLESSSRFYSDLDIKAQTVNIKGLDLKDHRNKNLPRPPDVEKPMFEGMIETIPIVLKIDTINLDKVNLTYTELGENKLQAGTATFNDINGTITGITTIPALQQEYQHLKAMLTAKLNDAAALKVKLDVPYDQEAFDMTVVVGKMNLSELNSSSIDMADIKFESGELEKIEYTMNASKTSGTSSLIMDYRELKMGVIKTTKNETVKKQGFISAIANSAIRADNMPGTKKYLVAQYTSVRNIYRGPFNFIWQGVKEGMAQIIPTRSIQTVLGVNKKPKMKKKE